MGVFPGDSINLSKWPLTEAFAIHVSHRDKSDDKNGSRASQSVNTEPVFRLGKICACDGVGSSEKYVTIKLAFSKPPSPFAPQDCIVFHPRLFVFASGLQRLRLGVTYEKGVTLGNVTMSHRTRERPAECLASLSHSTMIGLARAALEN
ncbi:hypothetical protein EVAR_5278_1 [Eumeta japonica]|uniref:Uncharacterized protein n=1 Tax=Eumeta variegata TaxID=151549 RepID=A0A4C1TN48_EUMVA|nr:hypothetical protein EVAR_5278_1 [Eumeta japonica]